MLEPAFPAAAVDPLGPPRVLARATEGSLLGGVAAGMAERWELRVARVRILWALAAAFLGLGVLGYAACWLVLPARGAQGSPTIVRTAAALGLGAAVLAGLGTLALAAGAATVFGFGWAVAAVAAGLLLVGLAAGPKLRPAWVLLPLGALTAPAIAVASTGIRIDAQAGEVTRRPTAPGEVPAQGYRAGLGDLLVDLRALQTPPDADVAIPIHTGTGATVVALPHARCVNLDVRWHTGRRGLPAHHVRVPQTAAYSDSYGAAGQWAASVDVFGQPQRGDSGRLVRRTSDPSAPWVRIDFSSVRGSLVVRDYPDATGPLFDTGWPASVAPASLDGVFSGGDGRPVLRTRAERAAGQRYAVRKARFATEIKALQQGPCAVAG